MAIFIQGMGNISPQQSWNDETTLLQAFDYRGNKVQCVEPDYAHWINPQHLMSMGRMARMSVTAGLMALHEAQCKNADGIITGTGYGSLEDSVSFLTRLIDDHEDIKGHASFFESPPDAIAAQLALYAGSAVYNQTYTHRAFSFESALLDAVMHLEEDPDKHLLVGGADEVTDVSHAIQSRFGIFRRKLASTVNLFKLPKNGTINGEGAAFFVLHGRQDALSQASIQAVHTLYKPSEQALRDGLEVFIRDNDLRPVEIDLVLLGKSGDKASDARLDQLCKYIFPTSSIGLYKHLCGEYPVASAFALWLGARILLERHIPEVVIYKHASRPVKNVLIFNAYFNTHYSFILLRSCHDTI